MDLIYSPSTNLVDAVIDEVALEGLDGITLEALWQRMAMRIQIDLPLPLPMMDQIWQICITTKELSFYELETPREKLIIFDRYKFVDPDLGTILEPDNIPEDIYEHFPIDDTKNGVKGSCKSYYTRKLIDSVENLTCAAAQELYGQKLVIVGSQKVRQSALMGYNVCPTLELQIMQYCFLERIGRSRYHGEVTQGKRSLSIMKENPKTLFYYRKYLLKHKLITKQAHHQKNSGHSTSGSLLHLPRFFVERKPKMIYLAQRIIEILKSRENYLADYSEIKKELQIESAIRKLFKMAFFQRYVRTDVQVPYRTLYPLAEKSEWQTKNNGKEKKIRAIQLIDPNTDIDELWNKDDFVDDEETYEIDISRQKVNVSLLQQANLAVESSYFEGLSQTELGIKLGTTKLQSRTILRNLQRNNIVGTYMNDIGRQRVTKYVSKKFEKGSCLSQKFHTEKTKMKEFTKIEFSNQDQSNKSIRATHKESRTPMVHQQIQESAMSVDPAPGSTLENTSETSKSDLSILFSATNRILNKYKLNRNSMKYQVTHDNIINRTKNISGCRKRKYSDRIKAHNVSVFNENSSTVQTQELSEMDMCDVQLYETPVLQSTKGELRSLLQEVNFDQVQNPGNITYRILRRANIILNAVRREKIIDDMTKLLKEINEKEEIEGYPGKIDKKSLIRLLHKLAMDRLVKNIKVTLTTHDGKKKSLTFICDPSIDIHHSVIESAVEQAKMKFCVMKPQKLKPIESPAEADLCTAPDKSSSKPPRKKMKLDKDMEIPIPPQIYNCKIGKRFGYSPKFIRIQIIHIMLYYLIYDHPGPSNVPRAQQIQRLRANGYQIDEKTERAITTIYNSEVNWKMFIPPLPIHNGFPHGWALMCDILLRLPLSIFLKIHKLPFAIPGLEYYIEHPIRKHFLVRNLPAPIRNGLMHKRKYVYDVHETLIRLSYLGLVQFGPQKLKEKEQIFFYVNRKSQLMDTTSSAAGYHIIEEKDYPIQHYCFDKIQIVEKYWYDMWNICINTPLGGRLAVQGTDIVLEDASKKPEMLATLKPRLDINDAPNHDTGHMPGDKKGAAGIDSALFAHLKRNWNWENFQGANLPKIGQEKPINSQRARNSHLSRIEAKPLNFTDFRGLQAVTGPTTLDTNQLKVAKVQKSQLTTSPQNKNSRSKITASARTTMKQSTIVRRVLPRKKTSRSKVKYDDIDHSALQNMEKLRVDWDPKEDNILLVCRVVMTYLCPNPRRQLISFAAVRDVLRSYFTTSHNKTSKACQRRLVYMLKRPQTSHSVGLGVEEMKQNYYLHKRYGDIVERIKKRRDPTRFDEKITEVFKSLVSYVAKKYYDISKPNTNEQEMSGSQGEVEMDLEDEEEEEDMPKTLQQFNLLYESSHPQKPGSHLGFTHDVRTINDIHTATINSVIYSSMCCGRDRRSWAYQLFRIYQQYSELLLRNAMGRIRADQMVAVKKHYINAIKKFGNCMPMSSSQYQLSSAYIYKFQTKVPTEAYDEIFDFLMKIIKNYQDQTIGIAGGIEVIPPTGGLVAVISDLLIHDRLDFNIEIPDHIITLNPELQDETYMRIAKRYEDILTSLTDPDENQKSSTLPTLASTMEFEPIPSTSKETVAPPAPAMESDIEGIKNITVNRRTVPKNHWTQGMLRKHFTGEKAADNDNLEEMSNELTIQEDDHDIADDDIDTDNDYLRLQDGTIIPITNNDIEIAKSTPLDESIHQAFELTRAQEMGLDARALRTVDRLRNIVIENQTRKMEVRDETVHLHKNDRESELCDNEDSMLKFSSDHLPKNSNFINDMIASCILPYEFEAEALLNLNYEDPGAAKRGHTRLALLQMREELIDNVPDSHHAHEYFVVNSFGLFYCFPRLKLLRDQNLDLNNSLIKSSELLMIEEGVHKMIMNDLRKFATFPKEPLDYTEILESTYELNREQAALVYQYVESKREQGATMKELVTKFYRKIDEKLYEILEFLTDQRLLLRSGITKMHYIHHNFVDPWLIHSMRIMRLQKEALPSVPYNAVYVLNTDGDNTEHNQNPKSTQNKQSPAKKYRRSDGKPENSSDSQKNLQKKRTCLLQNSEVYSAAKKLDMNSAEDIKVIVRPWIQIDGLINMKSLQQMLGSILGHCVSHPGIALLKVQERFIPALQPYHTRELVEILAQLGCLDIKVLQKGPANLFTNSINIKLNDPIKRNGKTEYENEIILEPAPGAMVRFCSFIRHSND
uniref:Uncharacterized protein n=1 Tax=Bracon brevicornis TaxID=1563983 RepID=A0A6V7I8R1_9HYME